MMVGRQVVDMVRRRIPSARVSLEEDTAGYRVRLRYDCPCGEISALDYVLSEWSPPAHYVADHIVAKMRAHVISEGNVPDFA